MSDKNSTADDKKIVYLEDIVTAPVAKPDPTPPSSGEAMKGTKVVAVVGAVVAGTKRQMTLESFGSKITNKKAKLSTGSSASTSITTTGVSRPAFGIQPLNFIPFSLADFQNSLSPMDRDLLQLECETMGKSWLKILKEEIKKPYFTSLKKLLKDEGVQYPESSGNLKVFPPAKDIYSWSRYTPLGRVRVVIVGQDPYHNNNQAHGLCFSVRPGIAVPPSLKNIYTEVKTCYPEFVPPKHGSLSSWAESGVLLLNTSLTVRAHQAGSHSKKGWETFTDAVINAVDKYGGASLSKEGVGRGVVFIAWGAWAAQRVAKLNKTKHLLLTSAHPSPLSAYKTPGFFGNLHFKKANDWLEEKYGTEGKVDWCTLDTPSKSTSAVAGEE